VAYHKVYGKKIQTTVFQNLIAFTNIKHLKTCLLPTAAIVLPQ